MLCWWRCWRHIFILLSMRSIVDAVLMTLLWVLTFVKGWPVTYNVRCAYLPLVWRSYEPPCLLPSKPCLYSKMRSLYMLIYVSPAHYNVSYVVFTTYIVCTPPWCGEFIFPHACCRPDRVFIAIEWVSCLWLIYCIRRQTLGDERVVFMFIGERVANVVNRKWASVCIYIYMVPLREVTRGVAQERNEKHPAWKEYHYAGNRRRIKIVFGSELLIIH